MSYEIAVILGILGIIALMFYIVSIFQKESEFMFPLKLFFFIIGIVLFLVIPSVLQTMVDANYDKEAGGNMSLDVYSNMTAKIGSTFSTMTTLVYLSFAYIIVYFIYWVLTLAGLIAKKPMGKDWKSDKGGKFD